MAWAGPGLGPSVSAASFPSSSPWVVGTGRSLFRQFVWLHSSFFLQLLHLNEGLFLVDEASSPSASSAGSSVTTGFGLGVGAGFFVGHRRLAALTLANFEQPTPIGLVVGHSSVAALLGGRFAVVRIVVASTADAPLLVATVPRSMVAMIALDRAGRLFVASNGDSDVQDHDFLTRRFCRLAYFPPFSLSLVKFPTPGQSPALTVQLQNISEPWSCKFSSYGLRDDLVCVSVFMYVCILLLFTPFFFQCSLDFSSTKMSPCEFAKNL